nr:VanZ family protein [Bacillus sp. THAF10]
MFIAVGWTLLLFYLSSMSYSEQTIRPYLQVLVTEQQIELVFSKLPFYIINDKITIENLGAYGLVEYLIRKGAHLFFYSVLGYTIVRYFTCSIGLKIRRLLFLSITTLLIISMMDEFLQHLHHGRSGQWSDVFLNGMGGIKGMITGLIAGYRIKHAATKQKSANPNL